jgi:alkyl hydroperoxide reductase subunit AhpF
MPMLTPQLRDQLRTRFAETLSEPVRLTLYTKPSSGRLILPSGMGCATCAETRELAEELVETAPERLGLEVVDVTEVDPPDHVTDVPTLVIGETGRVRFQGLPSGYEFATLIDSIERTSRADPGLSDETLSALEGLADDARILVFTTPT